MSAEAAQAINEAEKRGRTIGRQQVDIELYELKGAHRLTTNALVAAIQMLESGQRDKTLIEALKLAAIQAGEV